MAKCPDPLLAEYDISERPLKGIRYSNPAKATRPDEPALTRPH